MKKCILLIHCKDQKGIISIVTGFIQKLKGNVVYLDQHVDHCQGVFYMRLECDFESSINHYHFKKEFESTIATHFQMEWEIQYDSNLTKVAIFVSKYNHCLYDLLSRYASGNLKIEIPLIISNHNDLEPIAKKFDIPFYHIPISNKNKEIAEKEQLKLLEQNDIDLVVLARYMQIVSPNFIKKFPSKIINIHHSFLPAFPGAKPYHSAYKRGVKIIGATSHYVTEDLDAGPIIDQDVARVSHIHSIENLIELGKDLEKIVLYRAIKLHINRKTIVYNNKTVIFS